MPLRRLSRNTGISETLLDRFELGKNEIDLDNLLKISCVLQTRPEDLMKSLL